MADAKLPHNLNDALRAFIRVPADDLRPALAQLVEDLIHALDVLDGDPDLEPEEPEFDDDFEEDATSWGFA